MSGAAVSTDVRHWWGQRILTLLDEAGPSAARRVQRGQALARRGAVEELHLDAGQVAAAVAEDRVQPYRVTIAWPVADEQRWERATSVLSASLRHLAALLEATVSEELATALDEAGIALVPDLDELTPSCSCPERARWCRHAAAVLTLAAVQVDRDPALLLRLAGRPRDELLGALRRDGAPVIDQDSAVDLTGDAFAARGDLEAIALQPELVEDPSALLRQLGPPPGVDDPEPLLQLVERSAAAAWRLAAGDGAEVADEEALLAELRAQRVATAASLAGALGRDAEDVAASLDALYTRGEVLRTGSGERTRYRAATG